MKQYQLIIFDWDGTIMDSAAKIVASMQAAAEDLSVPAQTDQAIRNIIGLGLPEAIRELYPDCDADFIERFRLRYAHHYTSETNPIPYLPFAGAEELLQALSGTSLSLAVATGKSRKGLDRVLAYTGFARYFHASRCADETRSKPHPLMLHELLQHLQVPAGDALMIGDTEYDMAMAQQAGMDRLGVTYGSHELERLERYRPVHCVDALPEIGKFLLG